MLLFIGLSYVFTMMIGASALTVHITARGKMMETVTPLAKNKTTTLFLALVLIFNICDFLIIFLQDEISAEGIEWLYIVENMIEVLMVYDIVAMGREYVGKKIPRWAENTFLITGMVIFYGDAVYTIDNMYSSERSYAISMIVLNLIPIVIAAILGVKDWREAKIKQISSLSKQFLLLYNGLGLLLCVIATASMIDSRTTYDFIGYDKEIWVVVWLVFNVLNFLYIWKACMPYDYQKKNQISQKERLDQIVKEYNLSEREREIAEMLAQGKNNKEMAALLYLSPNTVKVHASNLYKKLGAANRVQVVQMLGGSPLVDENEEQ